MEARRASPAPQRPPALVLAGGKARRMGGAEKSLVMLRGRPLLAHVLGRLQPQAADIAISANGDPARFAGFGRPVLADTVPGYPGPLAGLLSGMIWAGNLGSRTIVSVPTDAPFLPGDLVLRLVRMSMRHADVPVLAASEGRRHPVVGLWPVALARKLSDFLSVGGNYRVAAFADASGAATADFPIATVRGRRLDPFFNVNTPEDLAMAEAVLDEAQR